MSIYAFLMTEALAQANSVHLHRPLAIVLFEFYDGERP